MLACSFHLTQSCVAFSLILALLLSMQKNDAMYIILWHYLQEEIFAYVFFIIRRRINYFISGETHTMHQLPIVWKANTFLPNKRNIFLFRIDDKFFVLLLLMTLVLFIFLFTLSLIRAFHVIFRNPRFHFRHHCY